MHTLHPSLAAPNDGRASARASRANLRVAAAAAWLLVVAWTGQAGAGRAFDDPAATDPSQPAGAYDADVVTAWYDLLLKLFADEKLTPPVAARVVVG